MGIKVTYDFSFFFYTVIYFERVDVYGHFYGPNSEPLRQLMYDLDKVMTNVVRKTQSEAGDINIVVCTDHGMTSISPQRTVNISHTLLPGDYKVAVVSPPIAFIWPQDGNVEAVSLNILLKNNSSFHTFLLKL